MQASGRLLSVVIPFFVMISDSQLQTKTVDENIPHGWIFASFMVSTSHS